MIGLLLIMGAVVIFIFTRSEIRLMAPFAICMGVGTVGMVLFLMASSDPVSPDDPFMPINPVSVAAAVMALLGFYGVFLLLVVWLARRVTAFFTAEKGQG